VRNLFVILKKNYDKYQYYKDAREE
jgi:hypothetical protein